MDWETLRYESSDHLGMLTLNRPACLNAINLRMADELIDFFTALRHELTTRVVVIRGAGRAFCAGGDLRGDRPGLEQGTEALGRVQSLYHQTQQVYSGIIEAARRAPQPLIAAVRGPASGGGCSLALAADIRIAGESARFQLAFAQLGGSNCELGTSYFLPRLVGLSRAAEYMFTNRAIDAATAERIGLVSRVVPDDQLDAAAVELAREILDNAPFGLRLTKETLYANVDAPSLESAIHLENRTQLACCMTEDGVAGMRAFLEKHPPVWRDR